MSEWTWVISLAVLVSSIGSTLVIVGRWSGGLKGYVDEQVSAERLARVNSFTDAKREHDKALAAAIEDRDAEMVRLHASWDDSQKGQDRIFGEVGAAMRQALADLKDEIHKKEVWNMQNYVQKPDFEKAIARLEAAVAASAKDIKEDFHRLLKPS